MGKSAICKANDQCCRQLCLQLVMRPYLCAAYAVLCCAVLQGDAELLAHLGKQYAKRKGVQDQAIASALFHLSLRLKSDNADALAGLAAVKAV